MTFLEFYNLQTKNIGYIRTDKNEGHNYIEAYYDYKFTPLVNEPIKLLEIGNFKFGSLILFRDWFKYGKVTGIEANPLIYNEKSKDFVYVSQHSEYLKHFNENKYSETIINGCDVYMLDAYSDETLNKFEDSYFDFIIDDGSHLLKDQEYVVKNWINKVKIGGTLVIEDIQKIEDCDYLESLLSDKEYKKTSIDLRNTKDNLPLDNILFEIIK